MKLRLTLCILLCTCKLFSRPALIIDTSGKDAHEYRNLTALLQSVGFQITYRDFFSFLNNPKIENYETIFFILDARAAINIKNTHVQKCIESVKSFAREGSKNIALLFPGNARRPWFINRMISILETFGVPAGIKARPILESFLRHAFRPDLLNGQTFGTTLINKGGKIPKAPRLKTMICSKTKQIVATTLPQTIKSFPHDTQSTFPLALFIKNNQLKNNYIIMKSSACTFSEFTENFFSNPINFDVRNKQLAALQQTFQEFHEAIKHKSMPCSVKTQKLKLPTVLSKEFVIAQKKKINKKLTNSTRNNKTHHWLLQKPVLVHYI